MSYSIINIPNTSASQQVGCGIDMLTGATTTAALVNGLVCIQNSDLKQTTGTYCMQNESSYEEMLSAIGQAEGSATLVSGTTVSGSGSASYASSLSVSTMSLVFATYKFVEVSQSLSDSANYAAATLSQSMLELAVNDPSTFLANNGTHFIAGYITGGSCLAGVEIVASTNEAAYDMAASFSGAISTFSGGKGSFNTEFQSAVKTSGSNYSIASYCNTVGTSPSNFSTSDVEAIQNYIDNEFNKDLGSGTCVVAICYPWEFLPCITSTQGYVMGSLCPVLNEGNVQALATEYANLQFVLQTATIMIDASCYVGPTSGKQLSQCKADIAEAIGNISSLTLGNLQNMMSTSSYILSPGYSAELQAIAGGRATINWSCTLDSAFTPNGSFSGSVSNMVPSTTPALQVVQHATHSGPNATLGFVYGVFPSPSSPKDPLGVYYYVEAQFNWSAGNSPAKGQQVSGIQAGTWSKSWWAPNNSYDQISATFG